MSGLAWWQLLGWAAGGILTGIVFVALAVYEERRAKKRGPRP